MITEDYVSFETAKLLKEKGFDEPCHALYHEGDDKIFFGLDVDSYHNTILNVDCYACPTLQMTMKWLREAHNIDISVTPDRKAGYSVLIFKDKRLPFDTLDSYSIYEQACEAAIKYCLEKLI